MNRYLFTIVATFYANVTFGNFIWIDALKNKTTDQRIILIGDRHVNDKSAAAQADSIVRILKSLPRQSTAILLESSHKNSSAFYKNYKKFSDQLRPDDALSQVTIKLDQAEIPYEGLDIRHDIIDFSSRQELWPAIQELGLGEPMHYDDAFEHYQGTINSVSEFFHCKERNIRRSAIANYCCSALEFTQAQHQQHFARFNHFASHEEFDIIALQKIVANSDKKIIFVIAGTNHCDRILSALEQTMEFASEKMPLQHITTAPVESRPSRDDYHKFYYKKILNTKLKNFVSAIKVTTASRLRPTEITGYLSSLPLIPPAPKFTVKRENPLTYPHIHKWTQDRLPSVAGFAVAACSALLFKRKVFGRKLF